MPTIKSKLLAVNDIASDNEDAAINIAVLANDTPAGTPKVLYSLAQNGIGVVTKATTKLGATITMNANGTVNYDPTNDLTIQALAQGQTATDTFIYTMKEANQLFTAAVTVNLTGVNDPATIKGTVAGQTTTDTVPINPFSGVTIGDVDNGAQDSLVIQTMGTGGQTYANGVLSGAGLTDNGDGSYTLAATSPAALTTELENLVFTPTAHQGPADTTITTNFNLSVSDGFATTPDNKTSVITKETAAPPPPPRDIIGYQTTLIDVPNPINTATVGAFGEDINSSGEVVGFYQTPVGSVGLANLTGFTFLNGIFTPITFPGAAQTEVDKVNDHGDFVGRWFDAINGANNFPFVYHNGVFTTIPTGAQSFPEGINNNGQVLIVGGAGQSTVSYIYDDNTGALTPILNNTGDSIFARAINDSGTVVGSYTTAANHFTDMGFIYDSTGFHTVNENTDPGVGTRIQAINNKGDFAGITEDQFGSHGFLEINHIVTHFDMGFVRDLNNNDVVAGSSSDDSTAQVYGGDLTKGQVLNISPNNSSGGIANGINDSNVVAGVTALGPSTSFVNHADYATPILAPV